MFVYLVTGMFTTSAYADLFDTEKSAIEISAALEDNVSSDVKKVGASWDLKWDTNSDLKISDLVLTISTKPYYKFSETDLVTEKEETTKIGLDVVKLTLEVGQLFPYASIGLEKLETDTTDTNGNVTVLDETVKKFGFGLVYKFGKDNWASITLYSDNKYEGNFDNKVTDESGLKFSIDIKKLLTKEKEGK